jgi:ketosteroid isomerase-like protein
LHDNARLVQSLYDALGRRDGAAMAGCYASGASFSDPVFPALCGAEVGAMWRMLCTRAEGIRVEVAGIVADEASGRADWQAWYAFSGTGRPVHNVIHAEFRFRDGRILTHVDDFDLWRWSRQALGAPGLLLGWSPLLRRKLRAQAASSLQKFGATR